MKVMRRPESCRWCLCMGPAGSRPLRRRRADTGQSDRQFVATIRIADTESEFERDKALGEYRHHFSDPMIARVEKGSLETESSIRYILSIITMIGWVIDTDSNS